LEREDLALRSVFGQVGVNRGRSVEERAEYGDLAKSVIRHVSTREAALVDVTKVASDHPELDALSAHLAHQSVTRRQALDRVERMSRGIQGINLNTGQDFDSEFTTLIQIVGAEIEWDLDEVIPAMRSALEQQSDGELSNAGTLARRAPTHLHPDGPRWYEHAPIISNMLSLYTRLRDFPTAVRTR
jgi:hypothetical protein